jgi:NAD(P)-dependent dehydrogenase (short-subunit alcohol dehydrogenase family)
VTGRYHRLGVDGKVVVVTGASDGIGKEIARGLARLGARVVMVGRNRAKTAAAADEVRRSGARRPDVVIADLASLASTRALAATLLERYPRIDVLVSNAGVFRLRRQLTVDGYEETFAVNHLAAYLLTCLLLDRLRASAPSRVVVVASDAHRGVVLDFEDLMSERRYRPMLAYARSKLANVMFTHALARRLEGSGVTANCCHPGFVATNLGSGNRIPVRPVMALLRLTRRAISPAEGADTPVWLASAPEVEGATGGYFERRRAVASSPASQDREAQERLWRESARLVGLA